MDTSSLHRNPKQLDLLKFTIEFYELIAELKQLQQQGLLDNEVKRQLDLREQPKPEEFAYGVQLRLRQWLDKNRRYYGERITARENEFMMRALFAMVALADELMLIEFDWPGQLHWQDVLLEQTMFQSCRAGSVLFEHMDKLLASRSHSPMERQLAAVYLLILRLGFEGRYREQTQKLNDYRKNLYKLVDQDEQATKNPVCADAYKHILVSLEQQRLAPISKWNRNVLLGVLVYAIVSTGIWALLSWQINSWMNFQ